MRTRLLLTGLALAIMLLAFGGWAVQLLRATSLRSTTTTNL
jgi:hypothetical protein